MPDPEKRPDRDYAVRSVRLCGEGRAFCSSPGHTPRTYWNPAALKHLLAGIPFALADPNLSAIA
jgi:type 1 glutamine amidotransferase